MYALQPIRIEYSPRCLYVFLCLFVSLSQGSEGFGAQVNNCLENAEYLYDQLQRRTDFELVFKNKVSKAGFHGGNVSS